MATCDRYNDFQILVTSGFSVFAHASSFTSTVITQEAHLCMAQKTRI